MVNLSRPPDTLDRRLMAALWRGARATHSALGEAVGRSTSAIARRQQALEEDGFIIGYGARLDLNRLGYSMTIHIRMSLESQRRDLMEAFEAAIVESPSVVRCDLISGSADYLVVVMARSLAHFAEVHRDELSRLPGVTQMESGFVLREVVASRLPLELTDGT